MLYPRTAPPATAFLARRRALEASPGSPSASSGLSEFTDKVFALLSISLVVAACVVAMRAWI